MRDATGMQQIGLGREGAQKTASEAIELLRMSQRRGNMMAYLEDRWIIDLARCLAELNERHLKPGEKVRIAGEGSISIIPPQALMAVQQALGESGLAPEQAAVLSAMIGQRMEAVNTEAANMMEVPPEAFDAEYDLTLEVGTELPLEVDREKKKEDLVKLFGIIGHAMPQIGVAILPQLLRAFDIEGADQIARQAQMQLQQAAMAEPVGVE